MLAESRPKEIHYIKLVLMCCVSLIDGAGGSFYFGKGLPKIIIQSVNYRKKGSTRGLKTKLNVKGFFIDENPSNVNEHE